MRELLEKCYNITKRIKEVSDNITEIESLLYYPKNQVLTSMPKSMGTGDAIDNLLSRCEELKDERKKLLSLRENLWEDITNQLDINGADADTKALIKYRVWYGYKWNDCISIMKKSTGKEWSENRVYSIYRSVCEKHIRKGG